MEHIQPNIKYNIRNGKNLYPYQCSKSPAIRDLFYRTYVVNSASSLNQETLGINKLSQKLKFSCDQYRKMMLDKFTKAQEECENERKQVFAKIQPHTCKCKGCQGCHAYHPKECGNIAKYLCKHCKDLLYCEACIQYNSCNKCSKPKDFLKIEQIPFDYTYPDFEEFLKASNEKKPE